MRGLLGIQWKLVAGVMAGAFVCLSFLGLLNRRLSDSHTLGGARNLAAGEARLNAERFNLAAGNIRTILDVLSVRVTSELDYIRDNNTRADLDRIAAFMAANLAGTGRILQRLSLILLPGVIAPPPGAERYFNADGYASLSFSKDGGAGAAADDDASAHLRPLLTTEQLRGRAWWTAVTERGEAVFAEPSVHIHTVGAVREPHVESAFILPVRHGDRIIGAASAGMCLTNFLGTLRTENAGGDTILLVSPAGTAVGAPESENSLSDIILPVDRKLSRLRNNVHPEILQAVAAGAEIRKSLPAAAGELFAAAAPVPVNGWSVLLLRNGADMLPKRTFAQSAAPFAVIAAAAALLGWLAAHLMGNTIRRAESWHRTVLDRLPAPLGILDTDSVWVYANAAIAEATGHNSPEELIGKHCRDCMPEADARFILATNSPGAAERETVEVRVGKDRRRIHTVSSCRLRGDDGRYLGRLVLGTDVTDTKEIRRTLALALGIARNLDARSERILGAAKSLSDSAMRKSAAIEEITSTTQKMGDAAGVYASSARESHSQAESTHAAAGRGEDEALLAAGAMAAVKESGEKVRSIIKLIDGIAFQTNLLALNAAVEAARAGRHGKGFAIVAEEVRNLAGRSAKAARETAEMIEEMSGRIDGATDGMEVLRATLTSIRGNAERLRDNSDEVAGIADQQAHSVRQVHLSLEQISQSVNSTIAVSRETATMAASIFEQAATLHRLTWSTQEDTAHTASARREIALADEIKDTEQ